MGRPKATQLSETELRVMQAISLGLSNAEAAEHLNMNFFVTKNLLKRAMTKLAVHNRTHAVIKCLKLGLVTLGEVDDTHHTQTQWLIEQRKAGESWWRPRSPTVTRLGTRELAMRELATLRARHHGWRFRAIRATTLLSVEAEDDDG